MDCTNRLPIVKAGKRRYSIVNTPMFTYGFLTPSMYQLSNEQGEFIILFWKYTPAPLTNRTELEVTMVRFCKLRSIRYQNIPDNFNLHVHKSLPHLVQTQAVVFTIREEALNDGESGLFSQHCQLSFGKVMHVAQTPTTLAPVQQEIPCINICCG